MFIFSVAVVLLDVVSPPPQAVKSIVVESIKSRDLICILISLFVKFSCIITQILPVRLIIFYSYNFLLLFTACGGGETTSSSTTATLNINNYISVAKILYAQQDGKQTTNKITTKNLKAPNASREKDTLYISKVQKPRGYKIENMEVLYNDKKLTISVISSIN